MPEKIIDKNPVFIFSAGWRSGSTMLQRLITASGDILMWGGPGGSLNALREAYDRYLQMLGPGEQRFQYGFGGEGASQYQQFKNDTSGGAGKWIASMNPPVERIHDAVRQMFETLYAQTAFELGFKRWGIKEVRSGLETAQFLRQIYPEAKFVFVIRNPVACLTSIKRHNWVDRKDKKYPLLYFTAIWKNLANGFRQADFGYVVKYEDLISEAGCVKTLGEYLEVLLPDDFIGKSHADWKADNSDNLSWFERAYTRIALRSEMEQFGYDK